MKNRNVLTGITAVLAMWCLCGCSLAVPDAGADGGDRMIGAFITADYLDLYDLEGM